MSVSLIQELEDIIRRTGSYTDRETLSKILEQLKQKPLSSWGYHEEKKVVRR